MSPTPYERARHALRPEGNVGARVRRHLAPPLVEDLEQAVAVAIAEAVAANDRRWQRAVGMSLDAAEELAAAEGGPA